MPIEVKGEWFWICMQVLEVIVIFVFSVIGPSRVGIGNRDRCWKDGSERYPLTVTRSAHVHIQFGQIFV